MTALAFDLLFDCCTAADAHALPRRGIRARTLLPSSTYDHLFELRRLDGRWLCVMRPGFEGFDKHYFEEVPAP